MTFIKSTIFVAATVCLAALVSGQFAVPELPQDPTGGQLGGIQNQTGSLPVGAETATVPSTPEVPAVPAVPGKFWSSLQFKNYF